MANELVASMAQDMELGKVFAESGLFPDIKSASQGLVKILAGKELGLSPIQSLNSFYFVNGRIGIVSQTMGALIKNSKKYEYETKEHTNETCKIAFYKIIDGKKELLGESVFGKVEAARAGVINKDNYKNYPMNMYFARALANGARWYCPDVISAFYIVEELQDLTPEKKEEVITINASGEVTKNG